MQYQLDAGLTLNKLANALGAEVTLFTRSPGKEADARRLGASHVVLSTDSEQMKATANQFDLIIDTVPYVHDLNPYIPTTALSGTLVLVGYLGALDPFLNTVPLIMDVGLWRVQLLAVLPKRKRCSIFAVSMVLPPMLK